MDQVAYALPGAIATYSAKAALFTASETDRGTFFDSTGSFTITIDTTAMSTGWSAWFRTVSGTQVLDPSGATLINGAATYSVANAGDVVLVTYTGSAFVISHTQRPSTVAISGGTIDGTPIGGTVRAAGAFTTLAANGAVTLTAGTASTTTLTGTLVVTGGVGASGTIFAGGFNTAGQYTSTIATGTAPLVIASTTVVGNLNVSQLLGATWAAPGTIGSGTPSTGAFTTLSATGAITSTLATGTAPLTIASTTVVGNLNVSQLLGATWTAPGTIGSGTPSSGAFTTLTANGATTLTAGTASSSTTTGTVVVTGGGGFSGALNAASIKFANAGSTLSNYDEGTFTPAIAGSSTAGTQTYAVQYGHYTRIGRTVFVVIDCAMSALDGTTAGNVLITGLPFASAGGSNNGGLCITLMTNTTLSAGKVWWRPRISPGSTQITMEENASAAGKTSLPVANLSATTNMRFAGSYEI